ASPFLAGSTLVAALARPPEVEIPGVRQVLRPGFDVTPEPPQRHDTGTGLRVGTVLDRAGRPAGPLRLPLASLNRHTFVAGSTGAGKTHTIGHLLTQATEAGIPWLVIEPAKAEYRRLAAHLATSTPGDAPTDGGHTAAYATGRARPDAQ